MQGRLGPRNDEEIVARQKMGITDMDRIYTAEELAQGEVMFAATGVTTGEFLLGRALLRRRRRDRSVVMRSKTGTIRYIRPSTARQEARVLLAEPRSASMPGATRSVVIDAPRSGSSR